MKSVIGLWVLLMPLITNCAAVDAVNHIGEVKVFNGIEGAIIWDDGAISIKETTYDQYDTSPISRKILSTRYYHITKQQVISLSPKVTKSHWLEFDHRPYILSSTDQMIGVINQVIDTNNPSKTPGVYAFYKGYYGQMKHPSKDPEFEVSLIQTRDSYVKKYKTTAGNISQVLVLPALALDIVTAPLQGIIFLVLLSQ